MGKWSRPQSAIGIIGHVLTFGIRNALAPAHRVIALKSRPSDGEHGSRMGVITVDE
jgi:hypothetical protein